MIKYNKRCRSCIMSKADPKFRKRVYHATFHREEGEETLYDIAWEFSLAPPQLYNHAKKHIKQSNPNIELKTLNKIAKVTAQHDNKLVEAIEQDITPVDLQTEHLQEVVKLSLADLRAGRVKVTVAHGIAAAGKLAEIEKNKKSQQLDVVKAMYMFASAEKAKSEGKKNELTSDLAGSLNQGEDGPDNLHRKVLGYVPARGPEDVHQGEPEA